jgi:hypothetical protein
MNKTAYDLAKEKAADFVARNGDGQQFVLKPLKTSEDELYKADIMIKEKRYATVTVDKVGFAQVAH